MNHQPYEDWLFHEPHYLEEELTAKEYSELQLHLADCTSCRLLADALRMAENELRAAPIISPEPGFTHRWLEKVERNRRQAHKKQSMIFLLVTISAAVMLLGLLSFTVWPWISNPNVVIWTYLYRFTKIYSYINTVQDIFGVLISSTARLVPITWWILLVGIICELGVLWIVFYRLITFPRRITQ
jgi:predicted anti-sigma-YlaC factor YlaD